MRILFAAPDRDLLQSCSELLTQDLGETVTAFDGTQVLSLLATERFDLAILDRTLPRIPLPHIVARLNEKHIPTVILINGPITLPDLMAQPLAVDHLSFPFDSDTLLAEARKVAALAGSGERVSFGDMEAEADTFYLNGSARITASEFGMLKALTAGQRVETAEQGVYAGALNEKLTKTNSRVRIRYQAGEGYQLVKDE